MNSRYWCFLFLVASASSKGWNDVKTSCPRILFIPFPARSHILWQLDLAKELKERNFDVIAALETTYLKLANSADVTVYDLGYSANDPIRGAEVLSDSKVNEEHLCATLSSMEPKEFDKNVLPCLILSHDRQEASIRQSLMGAIEHAHPALIVTDSNCNYVKSTAERLGIPYVEMHSAVPMGDPTYFAAAIGTTRPNFLQRFLTKTLCLLNDVCRSIVLGWDIPQLPWKRPSTRAAATVYGLFKGLHYPIEHPLPPSHVLVGYPIKTSTLKDDSLKSWLDDIDTVVYVSFGSHVNPTCRTLGEIARGAVAVSTTAHVLLSTRRREHCSIRTSTRIRIESWVDQRSVVTHSAVRAIVTHGGTVGLMEAIHAHKPVLVIPYWADQPVNAFLAFERRLGLTLHKDNVTEISVRETIRALLTDWKRYADTAKAMDQVRRLSGGVEKGANAIEMALLLTKPNSASHQQRRAAGALPLVLSLALAYVLYRALAVCRDWK